MFIDYEFSGFGSRAYEFGNLFNELTWDYEFPQDPFFSIKEENFPSEQL